MAAFPHPWDAYASAQLQLSTTGKCSDRSWGLEQVLNRLVDQIPPPLGDLAAIKATASRRARYDEALLDKYHQDLASEASSLMEQVEARSDLFQLQRGLSEVDFETLIDSALDERPNDLSDEAFRARLSRARRRARVLLEA
jgi:hypothetical protein